MCCVRCVYLGIARFILQVSNVQNGQQLAFHPEQQRAAGYFHPLRVCVFHVYPIYFSITNEHYREQLIPLIQNLALQFKFKLDSFRKIGGKNSLELHQAVGTAQWRGLEFCYNDQFSVAIVLPLRLLQQSFIIMKLSKEQRIYKQ